MIYTKKFLASASARRLPAWIRNHQYFEEHAKIEKVFPSLGLNNCMEPVEEEVMDYGEVGDGVKKKMSVVFSADGITGLWDLATMSMRGVSSCCHWDNGHSSSSSSGHTGGLIGPMTAPNTGLIYLTDGTMTEYGLSINKRSLVYYSDYGSEKHITVSHPFAKTTNRDPMIYRHDDPDITRTNKIFKTFLRSKLSSTKVC